MSVAPTANSFSIAHVFNAPIDRLFQVWTDVTHLQKWAGPAGVSISYLKSDIKVGGTAHYAMAPAQGSKSWGKAQYREIKMPHRLVYIQSFADEKGQIIRHPLSSSWPLEMLTTVVFEDQAPKSKLVLSWSPINANEQEIQTFNSAFDGMTQGWNSVFEQLTQYLETLQK